MRKWLSGRALPCFEWKGKENLRSPSKPLHSPCQGKIENLINLNLCGSGSVVERCLAKANVASSNLVFRSTKT